MNNGFLKIVVLTLCLLATKNATYADDDVNIAYNGLPETSRMFIEKHFSRDSQTREIEYENESGVYKVEMNNGYEIKFNSKGRVIEVDSPKGKSVDEILAKAVLPATIVNKLTSERLLDYIDEIKVLRDGGYLIEIDKYSKNRKMRFDSDGNFVKGRKR